jgi:hypothetical protein
MTINKFFEIMHTSGIFSRRPAVKTKHKLVFTTGNLFITFVNEVQ